MKIYVFIFCIIFASCKREDKVYNLLTNNGTFKAWDYVNVRDDEAKGGVVFSKDTSYVYYYTFYNDSIKVYNKNNDIGYKHYFEYLGDSIYTRRNNFKIRILYISEDSLVLRNISSENKYEIVYKKSKLQQMPMDYEEYKEIYPRPPIKWEVFGLTPPDF